MVLVHEQFFVRYFSSCNSGLAFKADEFTAGEVRLKFVCDF